MSRGRWGDEHGATAVEYGLVTAIVGVVFIAAGPALWNAFLSLLNVVLCAMVGGATCP